MIIAQDLETTVRKIVSSSFLSSSEYKNAQCDAKDATPSRAVYETGPCAK